jgi:hypothetical protein
LLETCRGSNKHIIEEIVHQVGQLPKLYEDAQSEKYIKNEKKSETSGFRSLKFSPAVPL